MISVKKQTEKFQAGGSGKKAPSKILGGQEMHAKILESIERSAALATAAMNKTIILGVIRREVAEKLLVDWANLRDQPDEKECLKLISNYREDVFEALLPIGDGELLGYRNQLRAAWDAPDAYRRDWYISQLRHVLKFRKQLNEAGIEAYTFLKETGDGQVERISGLPHRGQEFLLAPEVVTPIDAALYYFQKRVADRAKHCGGPDCAAPYFIAVKRWQKYCSPECAGPANREAKRRWWHEKGKGHL